jgi:small conductance mechanosensitive channel
LRGILGQMVVLFSPQTSVKPLARRLRWLFWLFLLLCLAALPALPAHAQATPTPAPGETPGDVPDRVDVEPLARDEQIRERLQNILEATGWFVAPNVEVNNGVVFLTGQTETEEFKRWAGDLARNTQDVAAVVNQITILEPSVWDFEPVLAGLREQGRRLVRAFPLIGFSLLVLIVAIFGARSAVSVARRLLHQRFKHSLLVNVIARSIGLIVFLLGLYIVFQIAGLTGIALTIVGGTGLLGLILGIAFRDITENFLSSLFLSVQNPFHTGDLVEIDGTVGFVQLLTTRATVLMTLDGNHVQIPNAIVYKSKIFNYTSNPNRRVAFTVGIGYEDKITTAQELILKLLAEHPAVLNDPEPLVLVDSLGDATVNLQIYFWVNGREHGLQKVRSSVIRLVKRAFQEANISMPDEAREVLFPEGVSVRMIEPKDAQPPPKSKLPEESDTISTEAEGGLRSEASEIETQARHSRTPESGENLLDASD